MRGRVCLLIFIVLAVFPSEATAADESSGFLELAPAEFDPGLADVPASAKWYGHCYPSGDLLEVNLNLEP